MSKPNLRLIFALAVVGMCGIAIAQNAIPNTAASKPQSFFGSMYGELVSTALQVTDRYLDHLAKPETAAKIATIQKNYYDALINKGFTNEQAFILVREAGNPLDQAPELGK